MIIIIIHSLLFIHFFSLILCICFSGDMIISKQKKTYPHICDDAQKHISTLFCLIFLLLFLISIGLCLSTVCAISSSLYIHSNNIYVYILFKRTKSHSYFYYYYYYSPLSVVTKQQARNKKTFGYHELRARKMKKKEKKKTLFET